MPEITRQRTGEFVQKLFEMLIKHPEGLQARTALDMLASSVTLTDYEAGEYESGGGKRFDKIVRFATVDCAKAGWLQKQKGTWIITADGVAAYNKFKDPAALYREATRLYRIWKSGREDEKSDTEEASINVASEATSITFDEAEEQAWGEVEKYLLKMNPYDFQELVADLIKAMGYHISWIAPPGKDSGIDIVAHADPLGAKPPRIKIQVKRRGDKISSDELKSFIASIGDDDVGLYVASGGFTRDAEDVARKQERRKITLINLERLFDLWTEYYDNLDDAARRRLPLTPIHFLTPDSK